MTESKHLAQLLKDQIERNAELERENERLRQQLEHPANDDGGYWTVAQASQELDVHTNTIYRAVKSGELKGAVLRVGRSIRLNKTAMASWKQGEAKKRRSRKIK